MNVSYLGINGICNFAIVFSLISKIKCNNVLLLQGHLYSIIQELVIQHCVEYCKFARQHLHIFICSRSVVVGSTMLPAEYLQSSSLLCAGLMV